MVTSELTQFFEVDKRSYEETLDKLIKGEYCRIIEKYGIFSFLLSDSGALEYIP